MRIKNLFMFAQLSILILFLYYLGGIILTLGVDLTLTMNFYLEYNEFNKSFLELWLYEPFSRGLLRAKVPFVSESTHLSFVKGAYFQSLLYRSWLFSCVQAFSTCVMFLFYWYRERKFNRYRKKSIKAEKSIVNSLRSSSKRKPSVSHHGNSDKVKD